MRPYELLPHRYPFIMLDTAEVIDKGSRARGFRQITIDDPIMRPDGTLPQVYIIEAMAQVSGIASGKKTRSLFAGISGLTFQNTAVAGDTLELESTVERSIGSMFIFTARALVAGRVIAEGGIVLHFDEE